MCRALRFSICVGIWLSPISLSVAQGVLTGPLINDTPRETNPIRGGFKVVANIGVSVVDTLAQTTRFTSNLFSLDIEGALSNLGDVFSKRSIDTILVQVIENLPEVLDKNLHLQYRPTSRHAVKDYFGDNRLDVKETAALFAFILKANGRSDKDGRAVANELRTALATMRKGGGNKSPKQIGKELGNSMRAAISAAPKPFPLFGNPLNTTRRLAITKGFVHSVLQTQAVPFAKGALIPVLADAKKSGVEINGLSDALLGNAINQVLVDFDATGCLERAKDDAELTVCAQQIEKNSNRALGSVLGVLATPLKSGKLSITLQNEQLVKKVNIGAHLSRSLSANAKDLQTLKRTGSSTSLNNIFNSAISSAALEIGDRLVESQLAPHFSDTPEMRARAEGHAKVLLDSFTSRLKLLKGGDGIAKQVEGFVKGGKDMDDNKVLDQRLRGPFAETLADPKSKTALLGLFVEKLPLTDVAKIELVRTYAAASAAKGPLKLPTTLSPGLAEFLKTFDTSIAKVSEIPAGKTLIQHLQSIVDPKSLVLNRIVTGFAPGATGLFRHYLECRKGTVLCDELIEPYRGHVDTLRDAEAGLKGRSFETACRAQAPVIVEELFKGVEGMKESIIQKPLDALLGLVSDRSQSALDCVLSGLASSKGLPVTEVERLHRVLSNSRVQNLEDRQELVRNLHAYLSSPTAGGAEQRALLTNIEKLSKTVIANYALDYVDEFGRGGETKLHTYLRSPENQRITTDMVHRIVANTDVIDQDTKLSLQDYAKRLADAPLKSGSDVDHAVHAGLKKTLADPGTRRDVLTLGLGLDDAMGPPKDGILGPGLQNRLVEAYSNAKLTGDGIEFAGPETGVHSFLRSFDTTVRTLADRRRPDESVIEFVSSLGKPESRVADGLIADQAQGLSDLLTSMISCRNGKADLCGSCLGGNGNWILTDPKAGTSEVLVNAPMGHILSILKMGLHPGLGLAHQKSCQAAIPQTLTNIVALPKQHPGAKGVLEDPALFLDALARPENQTALNCIIANYSEYHFLAPIRQAHVGTEGGVRSLLSYVGIPEDAALFELSGQRFFETLQKRNSNSELLKRKADVIAKFKLTLNKDTSRARHEMAISVRDLSRSLIVGTLGDPDMSQGLLNGKRFPGGLREWAKGTTVGTRLLTCMDRHYSAGLMPVALYASEDVSSTILGALQPWIASGEGGRKPPSAMSEGTPSVVMTPVEDVGAEACAANTPILSAVFDGSDKKKEDPKSLAAVASSPPLSSAPSMWVGGYDHTLRDFQALNAAEGSPIFDASGTKKVLAHTNDYQRLLNHLRMRGSLVGKEKGALNFVGDTLFEAQNAGPAGARAAKHLKDVFDFPADKMIELMQQQRDTPSARNEENLRKFFHKHCEEALNQWTVAPATRPSMSESSKDKH